MPVKDSFTALYSLNYLKMYGLGPPAITVANELGGGVRVQVPRLSRGILSTLARHRPTLSGPMMLDLVGCVAPFHGHSHRAAAPRDLRGALCETRQCSLPKSPLLYCLWIGFPDGD
ncbi:hypothetical protein NQZ68_021813 [Dissostichus eleginoides]|nr:hypothetical protein NQZ68_021813 [Dissostichus eleginoides]